MELHEQKIDAEASALWEQIHHCPAPRGFHGADLLGVIVDALPDCQYICFCSPYLRPSQIVMPWVT
jgi:hypothetical protein